ESSHRRGRVPGRLVLSPECHSNSSAAAAGTAGRYFSYGKILPGTVPQDHGKTDRGDHARRHGFAGSLRLARERARIGKHDGTLGRTGNGKHDLGGCTSR